MAGLNLSVVTTGTAGKIACVAGQTRTILQIVNGSIGPINVTFYLKAFGISSTDAQGTVFIKRSATAATGTAGATPTVQKDQPSVAGIHGITARENFTNGADPTGSPVTLRQYGLHNQNAVVSDSIEVEASDNIYIVFTCAANVDVTAMATIKT